MPVERGLIRTDRYFQKSGFKGKQGSFAFRHKQRKKNF